MPGPLPTQTEKNTQKFSDFNIKPMRTISAETNKTTKITPKSSFSPKK
jgi:hypothetical protein